MTTAGQRWNLAGLLVFAFALLLTGCMAQLAPAYDKNVAEGLADTSPKVMMLLASLSNGTDKSTFASREESYNKLIGKLDALAILSATRPMPKNKVTDVINHLFEKRGGAPLEDDDATPPSAHAIERISASLAKTRDADRQEGLSPFVVEGIKRQIIIYFDQAITYENFLQR